jgi:hypothetical protein
MSGFESAEKSLGAPAEPRYVAETLAWCNEKREEHGEPPLDRLPKGARKKGESCPCGAATGLFVGSYWLYANPYTLDLPLEALPASVRAFVFEFDQGNLPQYDLHAPAAPPLVHGGEE